jgi:hypothetical protein
MNSVKLLKIFLNLIMGVWFVNPAEFLDLKKTEVDALENVW